MPLLDKYPNVILNKTRFKVLALIAKLDIHVSVTADVGALEYHVSHTFL